MAGYVGRGIEYGNAVVDHFTGNGGATYTLTYDTNTNGVVVSLDGVVQKNGTDFNVTGTSLVFTSTVASPIAIQVIYTGLTLTFPTPADGTVTDAKITAMDASKLTGTIADARVPASAVTQHVTSYDDANIRSDILKLALHQAVDGNRVAYNLENSFVDGFEDDTGITTETNVDRDTTGEYVSSSYTTTTETSIASGDWSGGTSGYTLTTGGADQTGSNYSIYTDKTFSGDFTFQADNSWTGNTTGMVGIFDNSELGSFVGYPADRGGLQSMTASYWADSWYPGSSGNQAYYGGSNVGSTYTTVTNGGTVKFERVGTTIKLYIDGTLRHTYSQTSSATFRGALGGQDGTTNMQNIKWTETTTATNATGTLISDAQTASSSRTSCSGVIIYSDASGTATLGTDLKIYFTCNNGTNWTEASSYGTATTYSGTKKLVKLGATTCTAGTQVAMKAVWANQQSSSGTEKTITAVGDAQHATDQYKIGSSSAKFDGTGDALRIAGNLPAITGTGSFTAECWFRLNGSGTGHQRILNYGDSAGGSELINVDFYRPSSTLRCYASTSGSSRNIFSQTTTSHGISDNTWHHLAYVRNGTSFKVYIDGSEKVSGTSSSSIGTGTGFAFGGYYNDGGSSNEYFYGHIDEMRISSVARYTGAFTPSTSAFTADADTVLLIHSDTSNGSTTFADSSVVAGKETRLEGWAVNY